MKEYDVAIIGGGFAGLACARKAASQGMRTVVLERKADLGNNIRTTGILVKEAADLLNLPQHLGKSIGGVRLYSPNGNSIDLCSPGYSFVATDTPEMMRWLGRQAEWAWADIRLSQNVSEFYQKNGKIQMPEAGVQARFVVGCDGARSSVAKRFGLSSNQQFLMGVEAEYEGIEGLDPDRLHVFLDSELAPGYIGWIVPGVGVQQVGIAVRQPHKPNFAKFEAKMGKWFDFSKAKVTGRRGGLIPCGGVVRKWHANQVMLLGDSAGMVSPLTAGGIYPSIEIGLQAGHAISEHLKGRLDHPAANILDMIPNYHFKGMMRWSMDHFVPPNFTYDIALRNPVFRRVAQILFFHHRGLLSAKAWKEIVFMNEKHPLIAR